MMLTELSQVESTGQIFTFLFSLVLGISLSLTYDVFGCIRFLLGQKKWVTFVADVLFFLLAAVVFFCFLMIRCDGVFRIYALLGTALGFGVSRITVSRLFYSALVSITRWIQRLFGWIFRPFFICFGKTKSLFLTKTQKFGKTLKNIFKRKKKPLEKSHTVDV
jgi:spore cortex biosynthesis protein YabQ